MSLFTNSYVSEHSWEATGKVEKLSKKDVQNIISCKIKEKELEDGVVIRNIVLLVKGGKPESIKLAPETYQTQFPAGTNIDPSSIEYREYINEEGKKVWTATCRKA